MATKRTFYIGLNMAGAISAGAYTAGVIDFLIDALDTWYAARQEQHKLYGEDYSKWTIPAHDVKIVVMSGASAGGMTSAIAASALQRTFHPVRDPAHPAADNALYQGWVQSIDIEPLLGSVDLANPNATVVSLLDSSIIDKIAADCLRPGTDLPAGREYVLDGLKLILTLTNLRGVPYTIEKNNGAASQESVANYYADMQQFEVFRGTPKPESALSVPLSAGSPANWNYLQETAKATGAFPLMLAPRHLKRAAAEYNARTFNIAKADPTVVKGACACSEDVPQRPHWDLRDGDPFETFNVDGGVTNNSPFDCAHRALVSFDRANAPQGHAPRDARSADRAVITIAPFPVDDAFDPQYRPDTDLLKIGAKLFDVAVAQSRFQGENIHLAQQDDVFSRFAIAPVAAKNETKALACGTLSAFGGFLSQAFRAHDYQLGRRNCQQFLRAYFVLPPENPVMDSALPPAGPQRDTLLRKFAAQLPDGSPALPLIPLLGPLTDEIRVDPVQMRPAEVERLLPMVSARIKLVVTRMIEQRHIGWLPKEAFDVAWLLMHGKIQERLRTHILDSLAKDGFLRA